MKPIVYISGAMSGLPDSNYPAFNAAAAALRVQGFTVLNPAENPAPPCGSWAGYMRMALVQVTQAHGLVMLPGWESSRGARLEYQVATELGLPVITLDKALGTEAPL